MKKKIIPTVFSGNKKEFKRRMEIAKSLSGEIQVDFMDGKFVRKNSEKLNEIELDKRRKYEVHLMVFRPYNYIKLLKKIGFSKIIFHYEACNAEEIERTIILGRRHRMKVFIAVNPETSVTPIIPFLKEVDGILLLGVHPGKEKQHFISKVYSKIKEFRKIDKKIIIQIDGGVNADVAGRLAKLGADIINTGSFVAEAKEPEKMFDLLRKKFK